ncbi:MAG: zinc-dependent alcohol dehydrogenase family protein [Alphaproteobacteria bacterium]|nr:zinc-dependent alcohol dehydrogenase family protein [Alphaproteobacteria bacterium]
MRAMIIREPGEPEVFEAAEIERPAVPAGHLLVRVAATSVNPVDWKIRRLGLPLGPEMPAVLQGDVAGTVEEVGAGVSDFRPGDAVFGCAGGVRGSGGALAEYMLCDADLLALKPERLSMAEAAALPLVCLTAWEGLVDGADVGAGQRVLVHAGAGGVGHVALQIALARGARVFATHSGGRKEDLVRELGATPINYREQSVADYVAEHTGGAGFDVVYDTVGGDNIPLSWEAARPRGTVISCQSNSTQDLTPVHLKGLHHIGVLMLLPLLHGTGRAHHGLIMTQVAALAEEGRLRPVLDPAGFALADVAGAHAHLESGQAIGKVVVRVGD